MDSTFPTRYNRFPSKYDSFKPQVRYFNISNPATLLDKENF